MLILVAVPVAHATHTLSPGASLYSGVIEVVMRVECCGNDQTGLCVVLDQAEMDIPFRRDVLPLTKRRCAAPVLSSMLLLCSSQSLSLGRPA